MHTHIHTDTYIGRNNPLCKSCRIRALTQCPHIILKSLRCVCPLFWNELSSVLWISDVKITNLLRSVTGVCSFCHKVRQMLRGKEEHMWHIKHLFPSSNCLKRAVSYNVLLTLLTSSTFVLPGVFAARLWHHEERIFTVNYVQSFTVDRYCVFYRFVPLQCLLCFLVAVMFTANRHPPSLLLTHPHTHTHTHTYTVCGWGRSLAMVAGIWQAFPHMT